MDCLADSLSKQPPLLHPPPTLFPAQGRGNVPDRRSQGFSPLLSTELFRGANKETTRLERRREHSVRPRLPAAPGRCARTRKSAPRGRNAEVPGDNMAAPSSRARSASRQPATVARGGPYSVRTLTPLWLLMERRGFPHRHQNNPERARGRNSQDHQKRSPPAGQSRRKREEQGHSLNSFIPS